jgi:hypothetical protein
MASLHLNLSHGNQVYKAIIINVWVNAGRVMGSSTVYYVKSVLFFVQMVHIPPWLHEKGLFSLQM